MNNTKENLPNAVDSENTLYSLFNQAPAIIAMLEGPDHIFKIANPAYIDLVGQGREIMGKRVGDALPEAASQGFIDLLDNVYEKGETYQGKETPIKIDRSGTGVLEEVFLNFIYQPVRNNSGEIYGIFVHGVDVTEQVLSRRKIAESEAKYRSLFNSMDQGFCIIEMIFDNDRNPVDYKFLEVNPTFEQQTGLVDAEGKTMKELLPNIEKRWIEIYGNVAVTGNSTRFVEGSDVMDRWFEVFAFKMEGEESRKVALLFTDITERKLTDEALQKSENLMRLINNSIPAFISYVDTNERYVFVNDTYAKSFKLSADEVKFKHVKEIVGEKAYLKAKPVLEKAFSGVRSRYENTLNYGGKNIELEVEYVPDISEEGVVRGVVVLGHDITERKKSEEALRRIKDQLTITFQNVPSGIALLDNSANILFANDIGAFYLGYNNAEELLAEKSLNKIRKKFLDTFILQDDQGNRIDTDQMVFSRVMQGEKNPQATIRYINKNNRIDKYALVRGTSILNDDGELHMILISMTDITSQKRAEAALRKSEQYYKTMTDNTPVKTWITDKDARCTYLNKQWYDYSGLSPEEDLDEGWKKSIHPDDLRHASEIFFESNAQQKSFSYEFRIKNAAGQYRWHINSGLPKFDEYGRFEGFIGALIDIHERTLAEEKLQESEEFNRTLVDSTPDSVIALDINGNIISINPQGLKMMEIDDFVDYKNVEWAKLWSSEYYEAAKNAINKSIEGSISHFRGFSHTAKGTPKWWDVLVAPVYGASGKVDRLISVSRDITKLKHLEQQKDDFIGIASHELKTPVTSIKAYTQVLQEKLQQAGDMISANMLGKMDAQLNKLTYLITDLLDVTKIEQGELLFRYEEFDFNDLVVDVVEDIQRTAYKHQISLDLSPTLSYYGDKDRIGQVITNFLTNAIKYSPKDSDIKLFTSIKEDELELCVEDQGLGLSETDKEKVFERFYRVGGSGYETYPGLGLGLYISKEIIRRHGGRIWAESTIGEGSKFFFSLPLNKAKQD